MFFCPRRAAALLPLFLLLWACTGPVDQVREARLQPDPTVTVAQALERYPFFTSIAWSTYEDKDGKRIVEAACELDLAASCRGVDQAALRLATRDVARDLLVARFVVDGLPRRVRPLEAQHVTVCAGGQRLVLADPKFLRAVYNREQIRFFCLEGANCPGAAVSGPADRPPTP